MVAPCNSFADAILEIWLQNHTAVFDVTCNLFELLRHIFKMTIPIKDVGFLLQMLNKDDTLNRTVSRNHKCLGFILHVRLHKISPA